MPTKNRRVTMGSSPEDVALTKIARSRETTYDRSSALRHEAI